MTDAARPLAKARSHARSIDAYIAEQSDDVRPVLRLVQQSVRDAAPQAEESMSYGMPAFALHGRRLLQFAAWKHHYALYFSTPSFVATMHDELATYHITKGTISFPYTDPVPVSLIARIAAFRAAQIIERGRA